MGIAIIICLFFFQCVVAPTAMTIAAITAATKAKNADGTIMGLQQMFMNAGQAIGPIIGGTLYSTNLFAPFLYIACFEGIALILNIYVFYRGRKSGEVQRNLCNLKLEAPTSTSKA